MTSDITHPKYPWMPDGEIVANFAIGNLRENLLKWLTIEGRIHAETILTTVGALTGLSAQNAVWSRLKKGEVLPANGFLNMQTKSGELFYFGDTLNGYLVEQDPNILPLWGFVAAAAVRNGMPQDKLPDVGPLFQRAASTAGTPAYHELTVSPEHKPMLNPRRALEVFYPSAADILRFTGGPGPASGHSVNEEHWPTILSLVAQQLIVQTTAVLTPDLAFHIVMQSAIIGSKYDVSKMAFQYAKK